MSKLRSFSYLMLALTVFSIVGCETEIDIIAPQKDVTVIYGVLEANKTRHYIRINKAFIGKESAAVLAAQPGINEYTDAEMQAYIVEKDKDGNETGRRWDLQPTYIKSKEEGVFFSDSNKVYYFDATLSQNMTYLLSCAVNVEGEESKIVSAETSVIATSGAEVTLVKPRLSGDAEDRSEVEFTSNGDYRTSLELEWLRPFGGVSYTCFYRFYYTEVDLATQERFRDSLQFSAGTKSFTFEESQKEGSVSFSMNPEEFFIRMTTEFEDYDFENPTFDRIASDTLEFFLEIADNELATYIEVNQPTTEIAQEQPEYTNVTNGIGIFASRLVVSTKRKGSTFYLSGRVFSSKSLEELLYSNQVAPGEPGVNCDYKCSKSTADKGFKVPGRCNDETESCR